MSDDENDAPVLPAAKPKRLTVGRKAVVNTLWRAAKRHLDAHEARLDDLPTGSVASESDAKALAVLARTVRELVAMEAANASQEGKPTDEADPADGLRHVAELRKELARRLDALADRELGKADPAASPSGPGS
ncbi:hypothetical protein [Bosea sp. PAMC 26642]|uniref:hypothetical protein n=1 Tax=Bosea sp. (strain PAMC 26642) TaxID=1792307 RepID=UPI000A65141B|nr:hypothetical protein [Bosea sp. PAMC 26642]